MIDGTDIMQERWDQERELRPLSQTETAGPDHTARSARMTTIKTPEQIATEAMNAFTVTDRDEELGIDGDVEERSVGFIQTVIQQAIEADRAQRGIIEEIADVLDARGAAAAAQLVRDTDPDDDLWNYISPMIDEIEDDYTKMAAEIQRDFIASQTPGVAQ